MEVDPSTIPLPEDTPTQPQQRDIKLPPFWTTRPRAWFTFVESPFRLRGIEDDQSRFDLVLGTEFRSEKIPRNRLGLIFVIRRKKVLIPSHSDFRGRADSEARNGTEQSEIPRKK
jgi:hypothetical protein